MKKSDLVATRDSQGEYTVLDRDGRVVGECLARDANEAKDFAIEMWEIEQDGQLEDYWFA